MNNTIQKFIAENGINNTKLTHTEKPWWSHADNLEYTVSKYWDNDDFSSEYVHKIKVIDNDGRYFNYYMSDLEMSGFSVSLR